MEIDNKLKGKGRESIMWANLNKIQHMNSLLDLYLQHGNMLLTFHAYCTCLCKVFNSKNSLIIDPCLSISVYPHEKLTGQAIRKVILIPSTMTI